MTEKTSLFVKEEEDEDTPMLDHPDPIKVDPEEQDVDMKDVSNETPAAASTIAEAKSVDALLADMSDDDGDDIDVDDPIVNTFSINLIDSSKTHLNILQYINKNKLINRKKRADHPFVSNIRYKTKSSIWELDIPLDENSFFNVQKFKSGSSTTTVTSRDGDANAENEDDKLKDLNIQTLRGVGTPNNNQYVGFVANKKIFMTPVEHIVQLKPHFKYIDDMTLQAKKNNEGNNANRALPNKANQKAQVITMSVKSVNDQANERLLGSLRAHKQEATEQFTDLEWLEDDIDNPTEKTIFNNFKYSIIEEVRKHNLQCISNKDEYLLKLFQV